jgi:hypothetical protein
MKLKTEQLTSILLVSSLLLSSLMILAPIAKADGEPTALFRFYPGTVNINNVGDTFDIALVMETTGNLSGLDITITWNDTLLHYVTHTATWPVEDFPTPIAPSPYAGILHAPKLALIDAATDTGGDPDEDTYQLAAATLGGPGFNGSGTVVVMTFEAKYVPFDFEIPGPYLDTFFTYVAVDPARSTGAGGGQCPFTTQDGLVRIYPRPQVYPELPLLKVTDKDGGFELPADELIKGIPASTNCEFDVWLLAKNETTGAYVGLDPFWDIAGLDATLNFNTTLLEAVSVTIDPDGTFASFYPGGIQNIHDPLEGIIDNATGTVQVTFLGLPDFISGFHTPPSGFIRMFAVEFHALYDASTYPPPKEPLWLSSEFAYTGRYNFHSKSLIDLGAPVGTMWDEITPHYLARPFEVIGWDDTNGDSELSISDQLLINHTQTGYYFDYHVEDITGTLNLTMKSTQENTIWAANFPEAGLANNGLPGKMIAGSTPATYNGFGDPYWTGNFSMTYGIDSVNFIEVHALPFTGSEYTYNLVEGVDFVVHADDDLIELLNPLDVPIVNEMWTDGVDNALSGWPWINYVASGIQSVFVDMHNGTARFGRNLGYAMPPPSEWWYDPDWPWELEGWWALGYFCPAAYCWPAGSTWWVNYTAASYINVNYNVDPEKVYIDYDGTYPEFLALTNATNTVWNEIYPRSWQSYNWSEWVDNDTSGTISVGDGLIDPRGLVYEIDGIGTDLVLDRKPWVCDIGPPPTDPYFGMKPIVGISGFPHPERPMCPWHGRGYSPIIPHTVEEAYFEAYFLPPGAWIDLYVCDGTRPDPYGGQGPDQPSDMFWPQKEVTLCANVTYNFWPEQFKDVAFHIYMPGMELFGILYGKTDEHGTCVVTFRLPWPCEEWPNVIGVWHIEAFVDVACVVVNDTLEFHYDYLVNMVQVNTDKDAYKHCEDIWITVGFTSHAQMEQNVTVTVTIVDETGVPFGYIAVPVTVGGAVFCQAKYYEVTVPLHVVKWARAGVASIFAGALAYRGDPAGPVFLPPPTVGILAEWA